jgi:hypothetical protein
MLLFAHDCVIQARCRVDATVAAYAIAALMIRNCQQWS